MSAIMVARISIKNPEKFQQYMAKTQAVASQYGAELLFRAKSASALTGHELDHGLTVAVRFPSLEKINEWLNSEDYQPLIALREEAADMTMTSYEEMS